MKTRAQELARLDLTCNNYKQGDSIYEFDGGFGCQNCGNLEIRHTIKDLLGNPNYRVEQLELENQRLQDEINGLRIALEDAAAVLRRAA